MTLEADQNAGSIGQRGTRWNWWKIGFFVALIAFEIAREFAVLSFAEGASPSVLADVAHFGDYTTARGRWRRIDGGDRLSPTTVTIECRQDIGKCIEASTWVNDKFVGAPELDWFDADFKAEAISYENDLPKCAKYSVRIDLKLDKVFAVRERKEEAKDAACAKLERRIEMQLGDGFDAEDNSINDHFVPVFQIIAAVAKLL